MGSTGSVSGNVRGMQGIKGSVWVHQRGNLSAPGAPASFNGHRPTFKRLGACAYGFF